MKLIVALNWLSVRTRREVEEKASRTLRVYESPDDRYPRGWRVLETASSSGQNNWPGAEIELKELSLESLAEVVILFVADGDYYVRPETHGEESAYLKVWRVMPEKHSTTVCGKFAHTLYELACEEIKC